MTELKTLKDLLNEKRFDADKDIKLDAILLSDLKQEAIKWYKISFKEIAFDERRHQQLSGMREFIRDFFNLTEEDLK